LGWKLGCKGLTVYVTGSREEVVLETREKQKTEDASKEDKGENKVSEEVVNSGVKDEKKVEKESFDRGSDTKLGRDYRLEGATYSVKTPQGKAFITINKDSNGKPFEVFINVGKAGSDVSALSEGLGRLVSGWLRVPESSDFTVEEIISQLSGIGGSRSVGFGKKKVSSIPDAVAKVLSEEFGYLLPNGNSDSWNNNGKDIGDNNGDQGKDLSENISTRSFGNTDMCPDCGNYSFVKEEGCAKCHLCGYSVC